MSHFSVYVLVKKPTEEQVHKMLAPYDENKEVPEYETPCYCVNVEASDAARASVERYTPLEDLRVSFDQAHPLPPGARHYYDLNEAQREAHDEAWRAHIAPYEARLEELTKAHPRYQMPRPKCDDCGGTGKRETAFNPKSKWDWYAIGGRWAGTFRNVPRPATFDDVYKKRKIGDEYLKVSDLLAGWDMSMVPFAVLTPEEGWVERGEMGWWAHVSNEKKRSEWEPEVRALLAKYPEHYAVNVDCHI